MNNIIFLDIDEVLCTCRSRVAFNRITALDPVCCSMLHKLLIETNSKIVIHSSWRLITGGIDTFYEELDCACHKLKDFIIGTTPANIPDRMQSIYAWLSNHNDYNDFVIIDDLKLKPIKDIKKENIHKIIDPDVGLNYEDCRLIHNFFKEDYGK